MIWTDLLPTSTVTVYPALQVTLSPSTQTIDLGQTATISDTALSTGAPPFTFRWMEEAPGALNFAAATDCTDPTSAVCNFATSLSTTTGTYQFELQVTDSASTPETVTSSSASVMVNSALAVGSITSGSGLTIDSGQSLSLSASWTGGTAPYLVTWYSGSLPNCASNTLLSSDTGLAGSPVALVVSPTSSTSYCAVVTDSATGAPVQSATDTAVLVTVNPALVAGAITPASPGIDLGHSVTLTANPSGGTTPYSITWYSGSNSVCSSDTTPAGVGSSILVSPSSNTQYCYTVTDSSDGSPAASATSATDLVTINQALKPPTIKVAPSITGAGAKTNLVETMPFTSGTPAYTCEWLVEAPGAATFSILSPGSFACSAGTIFSRSAGPLNLAGTWSFKLQVSDSSAEVVISNTVKVLVLPPEIFLSPSSGRTGTTVNVFGFGFVPGWVVTIRFSGVVVATCTAKNGGILPSSCSFKVPSGNTIGMTYSVTATDVYGNVATASFKVR